MKQNNGKRESSFETRGNDSALKVGTRQGLSKAFC
jgi:hypothetical protein